MKIFSLQGMKRKKNTKANADKEYDDCYWDFLENTKILVLATLKHMTELELMFS